MRHHETRISKTTWPGQSLLIPWCQTFSWLTFCTWECCSTLFHSRDIVKTNFGCGVRHVFKKAQNLEFLSLCWLISKMLQVGLKEFPTPSSCWFELFSWTQTRRYLTFQFFSSPSSQCFYWYVFALIYSWKQVWHKWTGPNFVVQANFFLKMIFCIAFFSLLKRPIP